MGRRKKQVEIKAQSESTIKYKGQVKVKILDGSRVISSNKIRNKGKLPLFQFFAQCLTGKYSVAESDRPVYIQLYNADNLAEDKLFTEASTWQKRCNPVRLSTSPVVNYDQQNETAKCVLKFVIPFSLITNKVNINLLTLKSMSNVEDSDKTVCAYIVDTEEGGLIPDSMLDKEKYTLFIEWSLFIQDQNSL